MNSCVTCSASCGLFENKSRATQKIQKHFTLHGEPFFLHTSQRDDNSHKQQEQQCAIICRASRRFCPSRKVWQHLTSPNCSASFLFCVCCVLFLSSFFTNKHITTLHRAQVVALVAHCWYEIFFVSCAYINKQETSRNSSQYCGRVSTGTMQRCWSWAEERRLILCVWMMK